jgi:FtsP/CotA-like multicopper oxidase with cupredoxin domain
MMRLRPLLLLSAAVIGGPRVGPTVIAPVVAPVKRVVVNDNRHAAGHLIAHVLTLRLEARLGDWHPDGENAVGATVPAFAEEGQPTRIPGPLIRVPAGTEVVLSVHNTLTQPLTLHGLHDRRVAPAPSVADSAFALAPGMSRAIRFRLDAPGTYYYYGSTRAQTIDWRAGDDSQLNGAIVVDPPGANPTRDRVFVLGVWSDTAGRVLMRRTRILSVVNGRSWPNTERLDYAVGDSVRWRVINASADSHLMHLHGFYYLVDSRGDGVGDTTFALDRRRRVNTEDVQVGATMSMTWIPERAGNWLFHCHLPDHFRATGSLGLPRADTETNATHDMSANHALTGMNGLVVGVTVHNAPGKSTASAASRATGAIRDSRLLIRPSVGGTKAQPFYAFSLGTEGASATPDSGLRVGPPLVLMRGEPVRITLVNALDKPTTVHWHGIELESFYDGVAGFSGAGNMLAPVIAPHDSFAARFTPPRAGTFIYHTHVDEVVQQLAGLAGPLIVLEGTRTLDSANDHSVLITTPPVWEDEMRMVLMNGSASPAPLTIRAGAPQRFRFINMTTRRPNLRVEIDHDSTLLTWRPLARDGADLRPEWTRLGAARATLTIGETVDFEFTAESPGDVRVLVRAQTGLILGTMAVKVVAP